MNVNRAAMNLSTRTKPSNLKANFGKPLQDNLAKSCEIRLASSASSVSCLPISSGKELNSGKNSISVTHDKESNLIKDINRRPDNLAAGEFIEERPLLSFPGGGIYFYWQLGIIHYLKDKKYDLDNIQFVGASAGALTSTLVACNVDTIKATNLAIHLATKHNIWERGLGLIGIWGEIVEEWLDILLPQNAHEICNQKIHLFVTKIGYPYPERVCINHFNSREELIKVNMASVHIPYVMNKSFFSSINAQCTDEANYTRQKKMIQQFQIQNKKRKMSTSWLNSSTITTDTTDSAPIVNSEQFPQNIYPFSKSSRSSISSAFTLPSFPSSFFYSPQKFQEREPSAPKFATTRSEFTKSSSSLSAIGIVTRPEAASSSSSSFNSEARPSNPTKSPQSTFFKSFRLSGTQYTSGRDKRNKVNLFTLISPQNNNPENSKEGPKKKVTKEQDADDIPISQSNKKRKRSIDDSFYYIDGSFYLPRELMYVHGLEHPTIILDHNRDQKLHPPKSLFENPFKFIEAITPNRLHELVKLGYSYGEKLDKEKTFESLPKNGNQRLFVS